MKVKEYIKGIALLMLAAIIVVLFLVGILVLMAGILVLLALVLVYIKYKMWRLKRRPPKILEGPEDYY
ncbi:hypothetical protein A3L04_10185 [Thermococcus chitonophagus]|uniref:Uncharacterized protein n=1 Tax=Thermococcus chitonophagus TaxID=54262 RepID=A0A160VW20_9EURY|nr:hypothetical protein [Thermococcus chitonophagus]ASJ17411.1 hypothetical protein A3L04_10185 [Thermococcus chitonophagus]CUX78051.1 hypothetical protein CHITON_1272 [Thermococcus chitonophagus]